MPLKSTMAKMQPFLLSEPAADTKISSKINNFKRKSISEKSDILESTLKPKGRVRRKSLNRPLEIDKNSIIWV